MQVSLIGVQNIDAIWPHLRDGFQRAVMKTGGDIETGELWVQCRSGEAFLLVAHDTEIKGASIWKPQTWQTGRKLRCMGLYGTGMSEWIQDMRAMAEQIAKDNGATSLVTEGRVGWTKIFPKARILRSLYEEQINAG